MANNYKVRLISVASLIKGTSTGDVSQVAFDVTPTFTESRSVEYSQITPVHMPGGIQVYKHTNSRTFSLGVKLISRTITEASLNKIRLQTLRGWTMPYFGSTTTYSGSSSASQASANQQAADTATGSSERALTPTERANNAVSRAASSGIELRGAPPDVLYLYAYSTSANDGSVSTNERPADYAVNINRVPVVITSLDITYPDDVDYLPTYTDITNKTIDQYSEPFPVKMDISIQLAETHSPREYEQFDLLKYKRGALAGF